jgi:hypothetical protein
VPKADSALRNAFGNRAWPEYLDAADDARPLVVLVSNSQGVGAEIGDQNATYAALLRAHLVSEGYRFENWSTRGLRTTELELLVLRAVSRHARHILFVVTANNFDPEERINLRYPFSDLTLLAGSPALWPAARHALFMRNTSVDELLLMFASLHSNLVRSRAAVIDLAAARFPLDAHKYLFGREVRREAMMDAMADPTISAYLPSSSLPDASLERRRAALLENPAEWKIGRRDERAETLRSLLPVIKEELWAARAHATWVWQPLTAGAASPKARASLGEFVERATPLIEANGMRCHDLIDAMGPELFATGGHLNAAGHERFAGLLIPIIDEEILERGRPR